MYLILICAFALLFAAFSAMQGIDIDQMIMYQAGLRLIKGQLLYKDFYIPHGPLGALTIAFFLKITPTGGWAILLASAVVNMVATIAMWDIVKRHTTEMIYPLSAALLTSIWFLPVFGTVYNDHLAYVFVLLSFVSFDRREKHLGFVVLSAFSLVIAFHFKQTVGLPGLLAFLLAKALVYGKKELFSKTNYIFLSSYFFGHLSVVLLILLFSDLSNYVLYTFSYPLSFSKAAGSSKQIINLLINLLLPFGINPVTMLTKLGWGRLVFYPVVLMLYFGYWISLKKTLKNHAQFALCFFILSTVFCSALLGRLFAHVFFGMGGVLALSLSSQATSLKVRTKIFAVLFIASIGLFYVYRLRPFLLSPDPFYTSTDLAPIRFESSAFSEASKKIITHIRQKPGKIAVLADSAYLIPLALRQATTNPSVLYHEALTIPLDTNERKSWETNTITQIESNATEYILIMRPIHNGFRIISDENGTILPVPLIKKYVALNYKTVVIDIFFNLMERNK